MQQELPETAREAEVTGTRVRHLRQILLWPVQLLPLEEGSKLQHWEHLAQSGS